MFSVGFGYWDALTSKGLLPLILVNAIAEIDAETIKSNAYPFAA